jgi:hypothetical protein
MNIHSCSYYCHRPACIKAQRDELRDKLAALIAERDALLGALEWLATPPDCGCSHPCRCNGNEWAEAELDGRIDFAQEAIEAAKRQE